MNNDNRKESFVLHLDMLQDVETMTETEKAQFLDFIIAYNKGDTTIDSIPQGMFRNYLRLFTNQFDRDHEKWLKTKQRRAEAGRKGGIAKATNSKHLPDNSSKCYDLPSKAKHNGNGNANGNEKININGSANVDFVIDERPF